MVMAMACVWPDAPYPLPRLDPDCDDRPDMNKDS